MLNGWVFLLLVLREPVSLRVTPQYVYLGKPLEIRIHAVYQEGDRFMRLEWDPPTVGDSEWPVDPQSMSSWKLVRRVYEPGAYRVRASIMGRSWRYSPVVTVTVLE